MTAVRQPIRASEAGKSLAAAIARLEADDFREPLEEMIETFHAGVEDNFLATQTPEGKRWAPRKDALSHPLLRLSGDMFFEAVFGTAEYTDKAARASIDPSDIPYAAAQNYGSEENNLPAREFYGAGEGRLSEMDNIIADYGLEFF